MLDHKNWCETRSLDTILSSPFCSCILFAIVLEQLVKLEFVAQQVELKWLMLNK